MPGKNLIDLSGNYRVEKSAEIEANKIFKEVKKQKQDDYNYEQSEVFLKMKAEWQALQQDPSAIDDQIKQ